MALPNNRPHNDVEIGPFDIADIGAAASSNKHQCLWNGQIVALKCLITADTVTSAKTLTIKKNGTAITGISLSIPNATAPVAYSADVSPNLVAAHVEEDDYLEVASDGAGTGGAARCMIVVRR
jgi:hypothetical protein